MNIFKNLTFILIIVTNLIGSSLSDAFIKVAELANPAVVSIVGKQDMEQSFNNDPFYRHFQDFFELPENYGTSLGSGVIIDDYNGYILTNNHVIKEADEITITLYDKREYIAEVIGTDQLSDLALLKIDAKNLSDVKLGNSDMLKVGEWVVAIGNPFQQSLSNTVTAGIVSAKGRSDIISNRNIENFIQHDAAINPGNSGGALLNLNGDLIGINTAIATGNSWSPQNAGIGFAIPINQAKRVVDDLLEFGSVSRGFLGVSMSPIDDVMARALGMKDVKGALIVAVVDDSPADIAGLKEQDVILKVDGDSADNPSKLRLLISSKHPGDKAKLLILRNQKQKKITVTLSARPGEENLSKKSDANNFDTLGLIVSDSTGSVKIKKIDADSNAYKRGLRKDDIIDKINTHLITDLNDYNKVISEIKSGDVIMVRKVLKDGRTQYIAFEIN
tara:strand:+ start:1211 stop:2548 length:1338 start_codon:yes stop_codon:yes gene_type:complete